MKKITLTLFVITGFTLAISSCKKDDNSSSSTTSTTGTTSGTVNNGSMKANIDGVAWTSTSSSSDNTLILVEDEGKRMDLRGTSADGKRIILTLADEDYTIESMPLKTYSFEDTNDALFTYTIGNETKHIPVSGTITLTAIDPAAKKVSGTFNFKLFDATNSDDTLNVTNGIFTDLKYRVIK